MVDFDMANPNTDCPSGWTESQFSKRTCGRSNNDPNTCSPASFTFDEQTFSRVCGRVKAYAYGEVDGFENFLTNPNINDSYVSGVSLTIDTTSMTPTITHVWTFAAGLSENGRMNTPNEVPDQCPCDVSTINITVPPFVGNNYFCEAGIDEFQVEPATFVFQASDPLWDGQNCNDASNCCEFNRPPYFVTDLGMTVTKGAIDARICLQEGAPASIGANGDDVLVEIVEIYVAE